MKTIEIGEGCFGPSVVIDGENIHLHEYDERGEEYIRQLKLKLIEELKNNIDNVPLYELRSISEIVVTYGDGWSYQNEESRKSFCYQCGNYNYTDIYIKNGEKKIFY
jgi:predicted house-cleaning noncanonical NTP pyrophosphatase (MazG superfamily)